MHINEPTLFILGADYSQAKDFSKETNHLNTCVDCQRKFQKIKKAQLSTPPVPPQGDSFSKLMAKIKTTEKKERPVPSHRKLSLQWISLPMIAGALILVLLGVGILSILPTKQTIFITDHHAANEIIYTKKNSLPKLLQESDLVLNSGSSLSTKDSTLQMQIGDNKALRLNQQSELFIKAPGEFELVKGSLVFKLFKNQKSSFLNNPFKKIFKLSVNGLQIRVIGTKFHLIKRNKAIEVTVERGHLEITKGEVKKELFDGDRLVYSNEMISITKPTILPKMLVQTKLSIVDYGHFIKKQNNNIAGKGIIHKDGNKYSSALSLTLDSKFKLPSSSIDIPTLKNERMYFTGNGQLYAAHAQSGEFIWQKPFAEELSGPILMLKSFLVLPTKKAGIYILTSSDGKVVKKISTGILGTSSVAIHQNSLIYANTSGKVVSYSLNQEISKWDMNLKDEFYTIPVLYEKNSLILVGYKGKLYKIDLDTGSSTLLLQLKGNFLSVFSAVKPIIQDHILYLSGVNEYLYAVDLKTQKVKWRYINKSHLLSNPVVHGENILVTSTDRHLHIIDKKKGTLKSKLKTSSKLNQAPLIVNDSVVLMLDQEVIILDSRYKQIKTLNHPAKYCFYRDSLLSIVSSSGKTHNYRIQ